MDLEKLWLYEDKLHVQKYLYPINIFNEIDTALVEPIIKLINDAIIDKARFEQLCADNSDDAILQSIEWPILKLEISSCGGSARKALNLCNTMERAKAAGLVVATHVTGSAFSAALIVSCAGTRGFRTAARNSFFMIHNGWTSLTGKTFEIENEKIYTDQLFECTDDVIIANSKIKKRQLNKIMGTKVDYYFNVERALEFELIDEVI